MKNSLRLYSVFFIVIVAFALDNCKQKEKKDVPEERVVLPGTKQIVLLVDTENIKPGSPSEIKSYCSFPDLPHGGSIEDYTTDVLPDDSIAWLGMSKSAPLEDDVSIEMINYKSGNKVYGGPRKGVNGKVEGKIKDDVDSGQVETYTIQFRVIINGDSSGTYNLDPKLLVH